jgi:hypothetical protein
MNWVQGAKFLQESGQGLKLIADVSKVSIWIKRWSFHSFSLRFIWRRKCRNKFEEVVFCQKFGLHNEEKKREGTGIATNTNLGEIGSTAHGQLSGWVGQVTVNADDDHECCSLPCTRFVNQSNCLFVCLLRWRNMHSGLRLPYSIFLIGK